MANEDSSLIIVDLPSIKPLRIPKRIGGAVDLYYKTKATRLALEKQVEALRKQEQALKDHCINTIPKSNATGVSGAIGRARIVPKEKPRVDDWVKVYRYIRRHDAFDMLQRRLSEKAVEERMEHARGHKLPGISMFPYVDVSLTKA